MIFGFWLINEKLLQNNKILARASKKNPGINGLLMDQK